MSAVWRVSRAAVRRRRLQTIVLGVVVWLATTMIVVALGLLAASSAPFDHAYAQQRGAQLVAAYDNSKASPAQLAQAARWSGVTAVAGPFGQADVEVNFGEAGPRSPSLTLVGRADPDGPVDRLNVWHGRWATGPGEIVLNQNPAMGEPPRWGTQLSVSGGPELTVVGYAYSVSESADAWVTPDQMAALHPTTSQLLYRFSHAATDAQIDADRAAVTAGLPPGTLLGAASYLALKATVVSQASTYVPFLVVFGFLGLAVAVLIVANVVSGAVVAGFRHIGVLKALGFSPMQVMTVYLAMVSVPAVVGCVLGTVLGNVIAKPLLTSAFENFGANVGMAPWVDAATLLGMPVVVALSALVPALRARGLSATEAISAGSAQHAGRGLRIQRWLSGTRLPRSVSLGLGLPFARPARTALTLAAVLLGVTSVTFAIGLAASLTTYQHAESRMGAVQVQVEAGRGPSGGAPALSDPADEAMLRGLPGAAHVTAEASLLVRLIGDSQSAQARFYRGDTGSLGYQVLRGRWPDAPGQVAVSERFLRQRGLAIGDTVTVAAGGQRTQVRIVGQILVNAPVMISNWATLTLIAPDTRADSYEVQLRSGTDVSSYLAAIRVADPGLDAFPPDSDTDSFTAIVISLVTLLTLMLGAVAALGVFNTVVLNARERRRDLGMLKSIGMTPGQVTVMMVTSMAALGAVGGLLGIPFGIVAHRLVVPAMARAAQVGFPDFMLNVYHPLTLVLLALAGVAIAVLGAYLPARSAARTTIAEVLHNE